MIITILLQAAGSGSPFVSILFIVIIFSISFFLLKKVSNIIYRVLFSILITCLTAFFTISYVNSFETRKFQDNLEVGMKVVSKKGIIGDIKKIEGDLLFIHTNNDEELLLKKSEISRDKTNLLN